MEAAAYEEMSEVEQVHWWFYGRRLMARELLLQANLQHNAQILELGAGTGGNLSLLEQFGHVTAIEMDDNARRIAMSKTGYALKGGYLPDGLPQLNRQYDMVCMFDVLEHVEDDVQSLHKVHNLLGDNGKLLMSVPAHQWLWSKHDTYLHHFRRYGKNELNLKLKDTGFEIERLTFTNISFFPLAVIARLADKLMGSDEVQASSGSDIPPQLINNAMRAVYGAERHVLRHINLPVGLGLMALAKKIG